MSQLILRHHNHTISYFGARRGRFSTNMRTALRIRLSRRRTKKLFRVFSR